MSFTLPVRARLSIVTVFALSACSLLGSVAYQSVDASVVRSNAQDALMMARGKREAAKKAKAEIQAHAKPSLRDIKASGKENAAKAAETHGAANTVQYERSRCGDKLIIDPETCDDGNTQSGDGCSSSCVIETGFICTKGQPSSCWDTCGDGKVSTREKCDDGNGQYGDGCSENCEVEPGFKCSGSPSSCSHS